MSKIGPIFRICLLAGLATQLLGAMDDTRYKEIVRDIWKLHESLTESERKEFLELLKQRETSFVSDPEHLETCRFLLGDRKTHEEVIAKYRYNVLNGSAGNFGLVSASPRLETVTALGDLLVREEGGRVHGDLHIGNAAVNVTPVIREIMSRSPELPVGVVEWVRSFPPYQEGLWKALLRDWWVENERAMREMRYADVIPGALVEAATNTAKNVEATPPSLRQSSHEQAEVEQKTGAETKEGFSFYWIAITVVSIAMLVGFVVWQQSRRKIRR